MVLSSIFIFFRTAPEDNKNYKIFSKESFILANNWFMIFFLAVVLIGTLYPVFLDTLTGQKISVGPPYYNFILAPFLLPLLFLMTSGPNHKWISSDIKGIFDITLFISVILLFSIYLIIQTIFDFYETFKNKNINLSRIISHFGFGLLILSISLNQIFSVEKSFNAKLGDEKIFQNYIIKFNNLETFSKNNFKSVKGQFEVIDTKKTRSQFLSPEIRVYNQPETITYEASINTRLFSDTYLTMSNISNSDIFNIKFQKKPFMNFIWFSVLLISLGGIFQFLRFRTKT